MRTYNLGVDSVYTVKCNPVETEIIVGCGSDRTIALLDTRQKFPLKKVGSSCLLLFICFSVELILLFKGYCF